MKSLKIATRKSLLALWQSNFTKDKLLKIIPNCKINLVEMLTRGDIVLDKPLQDIGGKALFMKELEISMLKSETDIAVHSLKDIPYQLPNGFILTTFFKREEPRDAFVSNKYKSIDDLPKNAVIGTSSLRRSSQLLNYRNDLKIKSLRGNVQTRLNKLDVGDFDAIILAAAGLIRLQLNNRISQLIPTEIMLPAVGQGVVAIETLATNKETIHILEKLNDKNSKLCSIAERTFNEHLKGGCHMPIAGYAFFENKTLILQVKVLSSNGKNMIYMEDTTTSCPVELGKKLAEKMIKSGALELL